MKYKLDNRNNILKIFPGKKSETGDKVEYFNMISTLELNYGRGNFVLKPMMSNENFNGGEVDQIAFLIYPAD